MEKEKKSFNNLSWKTWDNIIKKRVYLCESNPTSSSFDYTRQDTIGWSQLLSTHVGPESPNTSRTTKGKTSEMSTSPVLNNVRNQKPQQWASQLILDQLSSSSLSLSLTQ